MKVLELEYSDTARIACTEVMGLQARFNNYCRVLREAKALLKQGNDISDELRVALWDERAAIQGALDAIPDNYWQYGFRGDVLSVRRAAMLKVLSEYIAFLDD